MRVIASFLALFALAIPLRAATDIQEFITPGGITVWLVEERSIPIIAIELSFRGGTSLDPKGKEGATYLMTGLLEEGAGDLDAEAFLRKTEELAARFSYRAFRDSVAISAELLSENASDSIELLRLALSQPAFDDVAVERVRRQVLSGLASDATDPDEIASAKFREISFPEHPYGAVDAGTTGSVAALNRDDLVAAHRGALVKSRVYVGVVGDVTREQAAAFVDTLVGGLSEEGPSPPPQTEMAVGGGVTVVDLDVPQSVALFGHKGIERDHPDYLTAYILNEIFGGNGLESRLQREVREKRGLTYGVYTFLNPSDHATQVMGSVASANNRIAEALDVIRNEWRLLAEEGVTVEELEAAKLYLTGAYPLRFDSNARIAGNLVGMQSIGLPIDYVKTRNDQVNAVTLEDINRVARELFRPDELHFVVVGKPEGL